MEADKGLMPSVLRLKDVRKVWHIERTGEEVVALGGITLGVGSSSTRGSSSRSEGLWLSVG